MEFESREQTGNDRYSPEASSRIERIDAGSSLRSADADLWQDELNKLGDRLMRGLHRTPAANSTADGNAPGPSGR